MRVSFLGAVFFILVVLTAMQGAYVYTPFAMLLFLPTYFHLPAPLSSVTYSMFVWWTNRFSTSWFSFVGLLLEVLHGCRVSYLIKTPSTTKLSDVDSTTKTNKSFVDKTQVLEGMKLNQFMTPAPKGKFNLIIMNHRTRIDWMLLWPLLSHAPKFFATFKVVLKSSLMKAPFFGWVMQSLRYLFLARNRAEDDAHIVDVMKNLHERNESVTYLIFPEGSDLSESNIEKSQAYAEKMGLPKYRKVLNPRTTGMLKMKNAIGVENIHAIYDLTIGYTDYVHGERTSDLGLLSGRMPRQLHFLCQKYSFDEAAAKQDQNVGLMPSDDTNFAKWIEDRFFEKEMILSKFYTENPVDFEPIEKQVMSPKLKEKIQSGAGSGIVNSLIVPLVMWLLPTFASLSKLAWERDVIAIFWFIWTTVFFVVISKQGGLDTFILRDQREKRLRETKKTQ